MADTPSRQSLERAFEKAPRFLRAVARVPRVAAALQRVGYTSAVHAQGWALLHAAAGFQAGEGASIAANPAADAMASLDAWDERGFALARAVLDWSHPDQAAFVFEGLKAGTGADAVVGIKLFLARLDALENGPERAATRDADQAALADLATAGINAGKRAELAQLVETAESVAPTLSPEDAAARDEAEAKAEKAMIELHRWYGRWSATARIAVAGKRDRISLGVSSPTRCAAPAESDAEPEVDAPTTEPAFATG